MNHKHYYCSGHEETQYTSNDTTDPTTEHHRGYIERANKSHGQSGKTQMTRFTMVHSLVICILIMHTNVYSVTAQQSPSISFISKEQVVEIGDRLVLKCITQYAKEYPVHWIHMDRDNPGRNLIITQSNNVVIPNPRYNLYVEGPSPNSAEKSYTLVIDKVQEVDTGRYACHLITGVNNKITAETEVLVRIPPIISDNSTRSVITSAGTDINLYCNGIGYPMPQISWRREKNKIIPGYGALVRGNRLTLFNISKDARGTYYCVADNGVSSGSRRSISVEVEFAPVVRAERKRYGQALQYEAILTCHIESFPSPSVEWYKDGQLISNNKNYRISQFATSDEFVETSLTVQKIEKKHYGNYLCKAANKLGPGQQEIELFETVNVICPPSCVGQQFTSSAYSIHNLVAMTNQLTGLIISSSIFISILFTCL